MIGPDLFDSLCFEQGCCVNCVGPVNWFGMIIDKQEHL